MQRHKMKKMSQQEVSDISQNLDLQNVTGNVSVGKIISNASGKGNHLYLDLGQQHWQSNKDIDDYGNKSV